MTEHITTADLAAGTLTVASVDYDRTAAMILDNAVVANESAANIANHSAEAKASLEAYGRIALPAMLKVLHEDTDDLGYAIALAEQVSVIVVDHATTEAKVHELARGMAAGF